MPSPGTVLNAFATIFGVGVDLGELFGGEASTASNTIRIHVGQQTGQDRADGTRPGGSPQGDAPGITIWDGIGQLIGTIEGKGNIGDGSSKDYSFNTGADKRAAEYVSVSASGSDGICIAAVTLSAANGNEYAWFGDVGKVCGVPWYHSSNKIGAKTPACVWIDTNADKGHKYNGFSMHMPSFFDKYRNQETADARQSQLEENPALMCKSKPRFTMWDEIVPQNSIPYFLLPLMMEDGLDSSADKDIVFNTSPGENLWSESETGVIEGQVGVGGVRSKDADPCAANRNDCHPSGPSAEENLALNDPVDVTRRKRKLRRRQEINARIMSDDLNISPHPYHSARELCEDPFSEGPDFVSLAEGLYCDMSTLDNRKQLYPLCSEAASTDCFDMESYSIRGEGGSGSIAEASIPSSTGSVGLSLASGAPVTRVIVPMSSVPSKAYGNVNNWQ